MDAIKYRKLYLQHNWDVNSFIMVRKKLPRWNFREHYGAGNHRDVLSGKCFWINNTELCMGYEMITNETIFRPIFSHKRQRLLDKVHLNIINPIKFWNKIKSRFFTTLSEKKNIPLECIMHIIPYVY